jgi:hypothetical protein
MGYGLDDSILGRDKRFSLFKSIHTGTGAHPASYPMSTGGLYPGGKVAEA